MNRYFEDTRYYVRRAAETAVKGVEAELAPVTERLARFRGEQEESGRLTEARAAAEGYRERAELELREAMMDLRRRVDEYRTA